MTAITSTLLLVSCIASVYLYFRIVPQVLKVEQDELIPFPPKDLDDIRQLLFIVERNANDRQLQVFLLYAIGYLIKQAYAIPGSALMNILGGALYGHLLGCFLVTVLTAVGSTLCYYISWFLARDVIQAYFSEQLKSLQSKVEDEQGDLFYLLLSMRMVSCLFIDA